MAKGETKKSAQRQPKPKTAAQKQRAEENHKAWEIRSAAIRQKQIEAHQAKKQALAVVVAKKALEDVRIAQERAFVEAALFGPSGIVLRRWLKNRSATFERVSRFFVERPELVAPVASPITKVA